MGSLSGSVLAAIMLAVVSAYLQAFPEIRMILYSLLLIVIMIFRPTGLIGQGEFKIEGLFRKRAVKKE